MRKEVKVENVEIEYYCDLCGEKQVGYSSMGSPTYPDELLKRCYICAKEVCDKCRICPPNADYNEQLCNNCAKENKALLEALKALIEGHNKKLSSFKKAIVKLRAERQPGLKIDPKYYS